MTWPTDAKAIFFDLDGTLADSLDVMKMVYRRFLESLGKEPSDAEFARLNGPPLREIAGILKRTHNLVDEEDQLLSKYQSILDRVYEEVEPAAGALELLQHTRARGMTTAVVTSNGRRRTESWLKRVGLFETIDDVVTSEDVTKGKPDPEPYMVALERPACKAHKPWLWKTRLRAPGQPEQQGSILLPCRLKQQKTGRTAYTKLPISKASRLYLLEQGLSFLKSSNFNSAIFQSSSVSISCTSDSGSSIAAVLAAKKRFSFKSVSFLIQ